MDLGTEHGGRSLNVIVAMREQQAQSGDSRQTRQGGLGCSSWRFQAFLFLLMLSLLMVLSFAIRKGSLITARGV